MTIQQQMKAKFKELKIPHKNIDVFGGEIIITCRSYGAAYRWAQTLSIFAKVTAVKVAWDDAKVNKGTVLLPTVERVYRVWATLRPEEEAEAAS